MIKRFLIMFFSFILLFIANFNLSYGQTSLKTKLDRVIKNSSLVKTSLVAVSIRDAKTGVLVYQRYGNYLLHTASTLKAFSTPLALEYLGSNNYLTTKLLISDTGNYYLKWSGDPLLTSSNLVELFKNAKNSGLSSINANLIIDDSLIDNLPWGVGWMWDDENNPLMPKYNAYNLDNNLIKVTLTSGRLNKPPKVTIDKYYPVKIINTAVCSKINKVKISRKQWKDPEAIFISGKVSRITSKTIPVGKPKNYFIYRLKQALKVNGISFKGKIVTGKAPQNCKLITEIKHKILDLVAFTNQKSNNLAAETLLKIVGAKYFNTTGTTKNGLLVMKYFYNKIGANMNDQEVVDASGASHNDLVQPNWMSLALTKLYNTSIYNVYKETLAKPGQRGTLKNRLKNLRNKLWAKTGTLAGISGITGYISSDSGKVYTFAVLIQNYKGSSLKAKSLENQIVSTISKF